MNLDQIKRQLCGDSLSLGLADEKIDFLLNYQNHQSISFYVDLASVIQKLYPCDTRLNILDVGSRTGSGAEFLANLFSYNSYSRIKASVTALDISAQFVEFSRIFNSKIKEYIVGDVGLLSEKFNVVIASHTIEHVPDMEKFISALVERSTQYVIIACPFMEGKANLSEEFVGLIPGHVNSIDYAFMAKYRPVYVDVYRALVWHQSMACIFVIDVTKLK